MDFVIGGADSLASTRRVGGVCPEDPADYDASRGLVEGDDCVRVCVTDGGANDLDTLRNGSVSDPASVAGDGPVPKSVEDSDIGGCTLSAGNRATITPLQRLDLWLLVVFIAVLGAYRRRPLRLRKT